MSANALVWHATAPESLRFLSATAGPAGVVLGRDHAGELAPLRLLRAEPTRVALVGGAWLECLVAFRCLGVGARIEVTTATPARWSWLTGQAGAADRVAVGGAADDLRRHDRPAGGRQPVLRINDLGLAVPAEPTGLGPWETQLTVIPTLTATTAPLLPEANAVLMQRLSLDEAAVCGSTLHLPVDTETKLAQLHDDLLVVMVGGVARFLWYAVTPIEEQLLGPPGRRDVGVSR
jgi:hypothetical protein